MYHAVGLIEFINRIIPIPPLSNKALDEGLAIVNRAMEDGLDFGMDMIAYIMANTTLMAVFPPWALVGGTKKLIERLSDDTTWAEIKYDMQTVVPEWPPWKGKSWSDNYSKALGWHIIRILSVGSEKNRELEGKSIVQIAKQWRVDPWEAARRLTIEEKGAVTILAGFPPGRWIEKMFSALFTHPQMSVMCDAVLPPIGPPPQAAYGTFPRFLGHYVRELKLLTLEEAIRRNTTLAAASYGIKERGELRDGYFADITIFDKDTIEDLSTPTDPARFPKGMEAVIINGKLVLDGDNYNPDANAGRVLRKTG
jgi:N-acyl-D-amino-acid deacylase